jgi:hypothetical protein
MGSFTVSIDFIKLANSSHAHQRDGFLFNDSIKTNMASSTNLSLLKTIPYLKFDISVKWY